MLDWIQIILTLWLIERVTIDRSRYKLTIDTNSGHQKGYWSIWFYHKSVGDNHYSRAGGKRLIYFEKYILPRFKN